MNQEKVKELALAGHNLFITGSAGTGKTYVLTEIIEELRDEGKIVAVTASTGISATHLNGATIHSWAGIGIKEKLEIEQLYKLRNNPFSKRRIALAHVLIIDEISMLHDYRLDLVDEVCRFIREDKKDLPFGGLQVIVCGDFFQLPPVNKGGGDPHYCFNAASWIRGNFKTTYLTKIYRQENDLPFMDILNSIRANEVTQKHRDILDGLEDNGVEENAINLFCKNVNVDILNAQGLSEIKEPHVIFNMTSGGIDFMVENLKKHCLAPSSLILKKGAHVMFLTNDFNRDIVNGTMGEVVDFIDHTTYNKYGEEKDKYEGLPLVRIFKTGEEEVAVPHKWELTEWDDTNKRDVIKASITQVPLRLAFAITIHKSQGATFDYIDLDLSDVFGQNMGYVALSRATSLDGIRLRGYNDLALCIDPVIIEKDKEFQEDSKKYE